MKEPPLKLLLPSSAGITMMMIWTLLLIGGLHLPMIHGGIEKGVPISTTSKAATKVFNPKLAKFQHDQAWLKLGKAKQDAEIKFKLYLRQCNLEEVEALTQAVSDPTNPQYRKFPSTEQVKAMLACPDRNETVQQIKQWASSADHVIRQKEKSNNGLAATIIKERSSYLEVTTTVEVAQLLFAAASSSISAANTDAAATTTIDSSTIITTTATAADDEAEEASTNSTTTTSDSQPSTRRRQLQGGKNDKGKVIFHHHQHAIEQHHHIIRANRPLTLPKELQKSVELVVGFHDLPAYRKYKAIPIGPTGMAKMEKRRKTAERHQEAQAVALQDKKGGREREEEEGQQQQQQEVDSNRRRKLGHSRVQTDPRLMVNHTTQTIVSPRLIHYIYNMPPPSVEDLINPKPPKGRQGIMEFDDYFSESDVCLSQNLVGQHGQWLQRPDITYHGDNTAYNTTADTAEATLDVEIMNNVAAGVPMDVINLSPSDWILDWAALVLEEYSPDAGGPLVWSVSYGWPERAQEVITGQDWQSYLQRSNIEFIKLALLGVTVLVSSGDDGAPGFSFTCPTDPSWPILGESCPLQQGCGCADFVLRKTFHSGSSSSVSSSSLSLPSDDDDDNDSEKDRDDSSKSEEDDAISFNLHDAASDGDGERKRKTAQEEKEKEEKEMVEKSCIFPLGFFYGGIYPEGTPGTDCEALFMDLECVEVMESFFFDQSSDPAGCEYGLSEGGLVYSSCQCEEVGTVRQIGGCSLEGYVFDAALHRSIFAPDFPASSPYVTTVGSTQIAADPYGGCSQVDILTQTQDREIATVLYNGGGGFSDTYPRPSWQEQAVNQYLQTYVQGTIDNSGSNTSGNSNTVGPPAGSFNASNRAFPDLSALGWLHLTIEEGQPSYMGGTSSSAPTIGGLIARLNEELLAAGQPQVGFLNPLLYHMAAQVPHAFNKVRPQTYTYTEFLTDDYTERRHPHSPAGVGDDDELPQEGGVDDVGPGLTLDEEALQGDNGTKKRRQDPSSLALTDVLKSYEGLTSNGGNNMTSTYTCKYGFQGSQEGWDPVTGLGTPNYAIWRNFLLKDRSLPSSAAVLSSTSSSATTAAASSGPTPTTDDDILIASSLAMEGKGKGEGFQEKKVSKAIAQSETDGGGGRISSIFSTMWKKSRSKATKGKPTTTSTAAGSSSSDGSTEGGEEGEEGGVNGIKGVIDEGMKNGGGIAVLLMGLGCVGVILAVLLTKRRLYRNGLRGSGGRLHKGFEGAGKGLTSVAPHKANHKISALTFPSTSSSAVVNSAPSMDDDEEYEEEEDDHHLPPPPPSGRGKETTPPPPQAGGGKGAIPTTTLSTSPTTTASATYPEPYPSRAVLEVRKTALLMSKVSSSASFEDDSCSVLPVRPDSPM